MTVLVDSNVILDVVTEDKKWFAWSAGRLSQFSESSILAINPIIYAEVSLAFYRIEDLESALPHSYLKRLELPWEAAFLAGRCFLEYRKKGGIRRSPLPDFYIGAHAALLGMTLLTRDAHGYLDYFPNLKVVKP